MDISFYKKKIINYFFDINININKDIFTDKRNIRAVFILIVKIIINITLKNFISLDV